MESSTRMSVTMMTKSMPDLDECNDLDGPIPARSGGFQRGASLTLRIQSATKESSTGGISSTTEAAASEPVGSWEPDMAVEIIRLMRESKQQESPKTAKSPFMVALVGCPGSGKSVSSMMLASLLEEAGSPTMVCPHDGYHYPLSYLRTLPNAEDAIYRRGAPDTFDSSTLLRDLIRIRGRGHPSEEKSDQAGGQSGFYEETETIIKLPAFDHATADPEPDTHIFDRNSHEIVICEGLYLLHEDDGWNEIANVFDYSIFMEADVDACIERAKIRNLCIPGYTPEEIVERCEKVDRVNAETVCKSRHRAKTSVRSLAAKPKES